MGYEKGQLFYYLNKNKYKGDLSIPCKNPSRFFF